MLVGGTTAQALDVKDISTADRDRIIPVILLVVFVVLALLLRSLVAPLLLLVCNVLSFAATLGAAALVFDHVLDLPGGDPTVPLYAFVFLVALGIDYSIFLMTRVREESLHRGTRAGVLTGLSVTGGVITSAGIVLAATFAALGVLPILFLLQIAFLVAFGVLLDTFGSGRCWSRPRCCSSAEGLVAQQAGEVRAHPHPIRELIMGLCPPTRRATARRRATTP